MSERHTNHTGWEFYGRWVEGRRVFVLLTPDVWGAGVMVLPKRGLNAPQDAERMRELLAALIDQHSVRAARKKGSDRPVEGQKGAEVVRDA